jgi:hypothetical protein
VVRTACKEGPGSRTNLLPILWLVLIKDGPSCAHSQSLAVTEESFFANVGLGPKSSIETVD